MGSSWSLRGRMCDTEWLASKLSWARDFLDEEAMGFAFSQQYQLQTQQFQDNEVAVVSELLVRLHESYTL